MASARSMLACLQQSRTVTSCTTRRTNRMSFSVLPSSSEYLSLPDQSSGRPASSAACSCWLIIRWWVHSGDGEADQRPERGSVSPATRSVRSSIFQDRALVSPLTSFAGTVVLRYTSESFCRDRASSIVDCRSVCFCMVVYGVRFGSVSVSVCMCLRPGNRR